MKQVIKSMLILFTSMWAGESIRSWIPAPIPTMIYAMVVLYLLLVFKVIKIEDIDNLATKLLSVLAFFFVPAAVGLMESYKIIETELFQVVIALLISFVLTVLAVGYTVYFVQKISLKHRNSDCSISREVSSDSHEKNNNTNSNEEDSHAA